MTTLGPPPPRPPIWTVCRLLLKTFPWVVFPGWLCALEILWERTYLPWAQGPVMVGFGLAHSLVGIFLLSALSLLLAWTVFAFIAVVANLVGERRTQWGLVRRAAVGLAAGLVVVLPFGTWEILPVLVLGPGNGSGKLMVEAGAQHSRFVVAVLRANDVDIDARSYRGGTALTEAAGDANIEFVRWLLEQGADPTVTDDLVGTTPLLEAIERNDIQVVQLLLDKGADPRHRDKRGKSGIDYAVARADSAILSAVKASADRRPPG